MKDRIEFLKELADAYQTLGKRNRDEGNYDEAASCFVASFSIYSAINILNGKESSIAFANSVIDGAKEAGR